MKKIHAVIGYRGWKGSSQVPLDESRCLVISCVDLTFVDELKMGAGLPWQEEIALRENQNCLGVRLRLDPFAILEIDSPTPDLKAHFTPDDWIEDTTDSLLCLPVSTIEWKEIW